MTFMISLFHRVHTFLLSIWQVSCSLATGSSLEEKSSISPKAERHVFSLVGIIDTLEHRVIE
jgi:hypothetical protein